jgi:sterol desaturase/sphingolipid hydroxylase (fatty acid hydroxylase superfamily)
MPPAMMQRPLQAGVDAIVRMSTTRANYWAEFAVDFVVGLGLGIAGWRHHESAAGALAAIVLGLVAFSFIEYCFHRWMFHTRIPLFAHGHHLHHQQPLGYESLPFFLPAAIVLALTGVCVLVLPTGFALLLMAGTTFGYILYGLSHFTIHHVRFRQPLLVRWAGAHHIHHHHPDSNFGVTTPLWDLLLGTRYLRRGRKP